MLYLYLYYIFAIFSVFMLDCISSSLYTFLKIYYNYFIINYIVFYTGNYKIVEKVRIIMEQEIINYGILSLLPAVLAIVLAFKTKDPIFAMLTSLFSGAMILCHGNPFTSLQMVFSDYLFVDIRSEYNAQCTIAMLFIGAFVEILEQCGGSHSFAASIAKKVKKKSTVQIAAWMGGLAIFFTESGNCFILGPIFRPIVDKLKVSREKLAFILDSTASPVPILIPVTGTGAYVIGLTLTEFKKLGITDSGFQTFCKAIPFQFYAIFCLVLVFVIAVSKQDFGPMKKAELRAEKFGLSKAQHSQAQSKNLQEVKERADKVNAWFMLLPLLAMFISMGVLFVSEGFPRKEITGATIFLGLSTGCLWGTVVVTIMLLVKKVMKFTDIMATLLTGVEKMSTVILVLLIAWSVGSMNTTLGTSQYIVNAATGILSPKLIPLMLFLIGALISFATGTSWGTMAIMVPLGINMAYSFGIPQYLAIAPVLSGALFGDHCSPVSDSTIYSAMASECTLMEHTLTQLPYALTSAGVAALCYLIVGIAEIPAYIALPVAVILLPVVYLAAARIFSGK